MKYVYIMDMWENCLLQLLDEFKYENLVEFARGNNNKPWFSCVFTFDGEIKRSDLLRRGIQSPVICEDLPSLIKAVETDLKRMSGPGWEYDLDNVRRLLDILMEEHRHQKIGFILQ